MALLMAFLLIVAFASLLASPSLSASSAPGGGFKAALKHVDHGKGLTPNEHFKRAVQRSKMAVESRKPRPSSFTGARIDSGKGEYFINLTIGTPPTTYLTLIDTDTDYIWTACKPIQCVVKGNECSKLQPFDPTTSSTYQKLSCTSAACKQTTNTSCNANGCAYKFQYPAGSPGWIQGDLAIETFGSSSFQAAKLIFGCTHTTSIDLGNLGSGFVGLGRGNMSLVSQLKVKKFSHCLPPYDKPQSSGVVAFGSYAKTKKGKGTVISDMLQNPNHPSAYYVALKGIKVNGISLAIEPSAFEINSTSGGVVIDSGMSVSYLEKGAFNKLKERLDRLINRTKVREADVGLDLCYKVPSEINLPQIAFTFGYGNRQADFVLQNGNGFRSYEDKKLGVVSCLAMAAAPASDGRSSLGNMQLQETLVVYDLAAKKVSFTPYTHCETT